MSKTPPANLTPGDGRNPAPAGEAAPVLSPEEKFQLFWEKNHRAIYVICAIILVAVAAKYSYEFVVAQHERSVQTAYAAATTPDQLRVFAREHGGNLLAGLAHLQLADRAYAAEKYSDAIPDYEKAAAALAGTPLAGRAKLGLAVCTLLSGARARGETQLRDLAENPTLLKAVRSEAAYHLASVALADGKPDDVKKFTDQIMQIDPGSAWAQRAISLRASAAPATAETAPASVTAPAAAPAIKFTAPGS